MTHRNGAGPSCLSHPMATWGLLTAPLLLLTLSAPAHADSLFVAPFRSYATGSEPYSMAIGDLNGDWVRPNSR